MKKQIHNFALNPDSDTLEQFEHCVNQEFVVKGALMPDAHSGYVAPIGSVLVTKEYVVPSWVGFDIGCGMTAVELKGNLLEKIRKKRDEIFDEVKKLVPMGKGNTNKLENISKEGKEEYTALVRKFGNGLHKKQVLDFLKGKAIRHLGTLGSGNHFIEIGCKVPTNTSEGSTGLGKDLSSAWVVVHSGSRGVGYKVAEFYMKKSAGKDKEFEKTYPINAESGLGKEYLNILEFGLEFALLNRKEIIKKVVEGIESVLGEKISYEMWTNKNHNHAIQEGKEFIHRKGATPAKKGERGVIPGNMRDGSFLVEGLGNEDFLNSSSHGAGRVMSRTEAREKISVNAFKEVMRGVKGTVGEGTLDEAPMAYKDIFEVMEAQRESVRIVAHLKPIINWKGEKARKNY